MYSQARIIWSIMRGHRMRYGMALACLVVATVINFGGPLVGSAAIDHAVASPPAGAATPRLVAIALRALGGASNLRASRSIRRGIRSRRPRRSRACTDSIPRVCYS